MENKKLKRNLILLYKVRRRHGAIHPGIGPLCHLKIAVHVVDFLRMLESMDGKHTGRPFKLHFHARGIKKCLSLDGVIRNC